MAYVYSFVKNICVFTLVITLILNIFPNSNYKKYIKLFAGVLLIALVLNPIVQWKNSKTDINKTINRYFNRVEDINMEHDIEEIESKIYERINNEYKENK